MRKKTKSLNLKFLCKNYSIFYFLKICFINIIQSVVVERDVRLASAALRIVARLDISPLDVDATQHETSSSSSSSSSTTLVEMPSATNVVVREAVESGARAAFDQVNSIQFPTHHTNTYRCS